MPNANPTPSSRTRDTLPAYRTPPKALADLVDAPPTPEVRLCPNRQWLLVMRRPALTSIRELAQPEARLAGLRIDPRTNGPSRRPGYERLALQRIDSGREIAITGVPRRAAIGSPAWSPDGQRLAFTVTRARNVELWVAPVETGRARGPVARNLNPVCGWPFQWLPDSRTLVCKVVPPGRGRPPKTPAVPLGPVIQESSGRKAPARTYQDLLRGPHDEALFEYYLGAQLLRVTVEGHATPLGSPGLFSRAMASPDGQCVLIERITRPFSYLVPVHRFGVSADVLDLTGAVIRHVGDRPLAEEMPMDFDAAPVGPRSFGWRGDAPATLCWVEARDGGDPATEAGVRDSVCMLPFPFDGEPRELIGLGYRLASVRWGHDRLAWVSESWWKTRRTRDWVVEPGTRGTTPRLMVDRSSEDRYSDPGQPLLQPTPSGYCVLQTAADGTAVLLAGPGASPEGDRPFLDQMDVGSGLSRRLWRSEAPWYERPIALMDQDRLLTWRESKTESPNVHLRRLHEGSVRPITRFPHPTPQLIDAEKELIRYRREDGVELTATLHLPPGHTAADGPVPMLMWAYPREFKSASAASQVTDSPHRFARCSVHSPLLWLARGYAVLDGPSMPIVGEGDEQPNDTYVEQLVASARAAVEEIVRRGVAEPNRIAIGGHSYGAFMTLNLLAHTDLFAAGIARSGAYNRTLTPFGFQCEERTLWEAPEVYFGMSPFMHVDKVNRPILLIHGMADNNSGTFPMQSERLYNALKGHAATTRLVMLPHESHGYQARESVMHTVWEMDRWLSEHLLPPRASTSGSESGSPSESQSGSGPPLVQHDPDADPDTDDERVPPRKG